jgi:hypothetical protein
MDDDRIVAVSPKHSVRLARELVTLVDHAPSSDYVVRTVMRKEANKMPLMSAEIVIAGRDARERFSLAARYPLHFRKTFSAARLGDTAQEFALHTLASKLVGVPPPIGASELVYRSCLVPGRPYNRLSPFGVEPEEANLAVARSLSLTEAAGLLHLVSEGVNVLSAMQAGGLAHGDAETHNFVVCPSPLQMVVIDFESAMQKSDLDDAAWTARCDRDLEPLLREFVFLECALGRQQGPVADRAHAAMNRVLKNPDRFRRAIEEHEDLES